MPSPSKRSWLRAFGRPAAAIVAMACCLSAGTAAPPSDKPTDAKARAGRLVDAMTLDEKIALVHTRFGTPLGGKPAPAGALQSAGLGAAVPRLGIPPLEETDAGLGVADPVNVHFGATAMPSALALGASFDPELAREVGATVGAEARDRGLGVVLGGGANLIREPRGGRDFEYVSEDPLLTGTIAGANIGGVQSRRLVCTLKHFALNDQENGRAIYSAHLGEAAARESDLLAFEIALARGRPGSVMTGYNRVGGAWASENAHLLLDVLKGDWRFPGWVMSDWGGVHSTLLAAYAGLDQESGEENDRAVYFGEPLRAAVLGGSLPHRRLDEMVGRQLAARIDAGLFDDPPRPGAIQDREAHHAIARKAATEAIVLMKNAGGVLPLRRDMKRLVLIGRMADRGVLSGGGSSQVFPDSSIRAEGEPPAMFYGEPKVYHPSSPLAALRDVLPGIEIAFLDGSDAAAAARAARGADAAIVVAEKWSNESLDQTDLALPHDQDALIAAVAAANPRTIVVLQTGNAVAMPWLAHVPAVLEAWYSGSEGARAIADVLVGRADPSGRLPLTFPADEAQLPRSTIPDHETTVSTAEDRRQVPALDIDYDVEGADVGYRWYLRERRVPLFAFGHGLSYTSFEHSELRATAGRAALSVSFDVRDAGARAGSDTPQVYLEGDGLTRRLVGFERVTLSPGETRHVTLAADARLLARYDPAQQGWHVAAGRYTVSLRANALADGPSVQVDMPDARWPARHGACGGVPCPDEVQATR